MSDHDSEASVGPAGSPEGAVGLPQRPAGFSRTSLIDVARLPQANAHGTLHGGEILKMADTTAGIVSYRHCGGQTVTRALESASFERAVEVGSLLRTTGTVVSVGRTSLRVVVLIECQPLFSVPPVAPVVGEVLEEEPWMRVAEVAFAMVRVDADGRPVPVPGLAEEPVSP